jgi:DNA-binding NarL/FixJ family response regulator/AraC-like DNA-binding protein
VAYRVLVAEDEELERRALRRILGGAGMPEIEVLEAANGREALDLAFRSRPDAALLDIRMPGIDGIQAARLLRERYPDLPIVFLTAFDSFEYARSALRLRVEDFLLKPASAEEVAATLNRALRGAATAFARASARPSATEARLETAISFLAQDIRDALGAGDLPKAAIGHYLGLARAVAGAAGSIGAVVVLRAEESGTEGAEARRRAMRGVAVLAERLLAKGEGVVLAGAGPARALCVIAPDPARDGACRESDLRCALDELAERSRSELGIALAIGAAIEAPRPVPAGAKAIAPREATEASTGAINELAAAARRAAALAGRGRPLIIVPLSPAGPAPLAPETADRESGGGGALTARRALELIEARHADDLSLEIVAAELGVSSSHLSRLLGRHAGLGFADCLARFRVERAKAFLASGTVSVKEAAFMVGFRDPAYFARVFRRFAGLSPTEYRLAAANADRSAKGDRKGGTR